MCNNIILTVISKENVTKLIWKAKRKAKTLILMAIIIYNENNNKAYVIIIM